MSMVARTGPKIRTGPDILVRILLVRSVVRIFRSGFFWYGPWSGFLGPDFHWSGTWSGLFGPDNPYRSGFFCGPVRGPDFFFKIKKSGPDQFFSKKIGPVRILVRIFENKKIRTGPTFVKKCRYGPDHGGSLQLQKNSYVSVVTVL